MPPVNILIVMNDTCLDRLLKQRSALQESSRPFDFPPLGGELRSLSIAADCLAAAIENFSQTFIQNPTNS